MNERIEKLVIEAFFDESTNGADQKMYTLGEEKIQKFAELIVRDCALTAGLMEHEGRKGIGAVILDNYGVRNEEV